MKNYLLASVLLLSFFLFGCTKIENNSAAISGNSRAGDTTINDVENTADTNGTIAEDNKSETGNDKTSVSNTITIEGIKNGDFVVSPTLISGKADIESDQVVVELRDIKHKAKVSVNAGVFNGEYKISKFWFEFNNTSEGFIAVYEKDNLDNLIEIPVKFKVAE